MALSFTVLFFIPKIKNSCGTLQSGGERADHEAELLQDHSVESVSGGDTVFEEGAWVEGWRATGEFSSPLSFLFFGLL